MRKIVGRGPQLASVHWSVMEFGPLNRVVLLGLLLVAQGPVLGMKLAVQVDDSERWSLGEQVDYLEDPTGQLTIVDALSQPGWRTSDNSSPNFGFTRSAYWFRVHIQNADATSKSLYLEAAYPLLDDVSLYRFIDGEWIETLRVGDMLPYAERPIDQRQLLLPIILEASASETLVLRVETTSSMQLPLVLWQPFAFYRNDQAMIIFYGGYFGLMAVMLLYNLVIYLSLRDSSYVYFIGMVASTAMVTALLAGISYQFLWPESASWNQRAITAATLFGCATWLLFADSFFSLDDHVSGLGHWFRMGAAATFVLMLATFALPHQTGISITTLWLVPTCLAVAWVGILLWYRGNKTARYYTLAWGGFIVGAIVLALNKQGLIARTFLTEHSAVIASAFEMVVLSLALAYRLSLIGRAERDHLRELADAKAERMASLTVLVTGVAHALNTPLGTGISAISHLGIKHDRFTNGHKSDDGSGTDEALQHYLDTVGKSCRLVSDNLERCAELVRSFKTIAIDLTEAMCAYRVEENIQRAIAELQLEIDRSGHQVEVSCEVEQEAHGYPTAVRRVLMALINNALEHAFPEDEKGRVQIAASVSNGSLSIKVNDNGVGIDRQHVKRVFDPFFTTQRGVGRKVGLGMHLVKSIVTQQLNGQVTVDSSAKGTRVAMDFPLRLDPEGSVRPTNDNPTGMG